MACNKVIFSSSFNCCCCCKNPFIAKKPKNNFYGCGCHKREYDKCGCKDNYKYDNYDKYDKHDKNDYWYPNYCFANCNYYYEDDCRFANNAWCW